MSGKYEQMNKISCHFHTDKQHTTLRYGADVDTVHQVRQQQF